MKIVLGLALLLASGAAAYALPPAPGPEIAAGLPAMIGVAGAYVATRFWRKRKG